MMQEHSDNIIAGASGIAGGFTAMINSVSVSNIFEVAVYSCISAIVGLSLKLMFDAIKRKYFKSKEVK